MSLRINRARTGMACVLGSVVLASSNALAAGDNIRGKTVVTDNT